MSCSRYILSWASLLNGGTSAGATKKALISVSDKTGLIKLAKVFDLLRPPQTQLDQDI